MGDITALDILALALFAAMLASAIIQIVTRIRDRRNDDSRPPGSGGWNYSNN